MTEQNYQRDITVRASAPEVYRALTSGYDKWWTSPDHNFVKPGDQATFTFPPGETFWTFEAEELDLDRKVVLRCVDACHLHEGMPPAIEKEWIGSSLQFRIDEADGECIIHFTHFGLVPGLHCFDVCEEGWDHFFVGSLKAYLNSGQGYAHDAAE